MLEWMPWLIADPLMDWKVIGVVFAGMDAVVAMITWSVRSPHPRLLDIVWCSAVVVVDVVEL